MVDEIGKLLEWHELTTKFSLSGFGIPKEGVQLTGLQLRELHGAGALSGRYVEVDEIANEELFGELTAALEDWLENYVTDGQVGDGLVGIGGGELLPTVDAYAKRLVHGAAILGHTRIVELLRGWREGRPARVNRQFVLANRVPDDQPTSIGIEGIRMEKVPDGAALPIAPSSLTVAGFAPHVFAGRYLVSLAFEQPGLYVPSSSNAWPTPGQSVCPEFRDGFDIQRFCDALSLVCDDHVRWMLETMDIGELAHLTSFGGSGSGFAHPGDMPAIERSGRETPIKQCQLQEVVRVHGQLGQVEDAKLKIATSRWVKSKRAVDADSLIDLRIALEALWGGRGELRFRTSLCGARHLGDSVESRKEYRKGIGEAYDLASRAVHAEVTTLDGKQKRIFRRGQAICREGILRCLDSGNVPDQDELLLGLE